MIREAFASISGPRLGFASKIAAGFALALLTTAPAVQAAPRGDVDQNGCWRGPRGGLHCPTFSQRRTERLMPGGAETRLERERRLKRECKGQRNAGACLGYGSWY